MAEFKGVNRDFANRVKAVARIEDVVGTFLEIKRIGNNYTALCPFHDDTKAGNFMIDPRKNICKCFACGTNAMSSVDFLMKLKGWSYPETIKWLAAKYSLINYREMANTQTQTQHKLRPRKKDLVLYHFIEKEGIFLECAKDEEIKFTSDDGFIYEVQKTINYIKNPLYEYLHKTLGNEGMRSKLQKVWNMYHVETSDGEKYPKTKGWCIFPLIDEHQRYLNAKFMRYNSDGHRFKPLPGSWDNYYINWLATMEEKAGRLNLEGRRIGRCLFGLHLMSKFANAQICIVESEKTAIIAQTFCNEKEMLFMATGGKEGITAELLRPLIRNKRSILLFPDIDALEVWTKKADKINNELEARQMVARVSVAQTIMARYDKKRDGAKADIGDILLNQWTDYLKKK